MVVLVLLDDAEDTGRRFASRLTARDRGSQDPAVDVVHSNLLAPQRNNRHDWLADGPRFDGYHRSFVATACGARKIACHDQRGQAGNGNMRRPKRSLFVLRVDKTRRHAMSPTTGLGEGRPSSYRYSVTNSNLLRKRARLTVAR